MRKRSACDKADLRKLWRGRLHPDHARFLLQRQLAAIDWIEDKPPPGCDLAAWEKFRSKLERLREATGRIEFSDIPKPPQA